MRVAILSLIEPAGEAGGLRGYLPIGGRSLLRHQIGLALSLGVKRIIVVAEGISGALVSLQHVAESGGAQFHVVATARALVPLVAPEDDVIVLGDGLLVLPTDFTALIEGGPAVLTLPVETALALGYERIDINHASAGAMRLPGRIAAGLADLPPEWHVHSALLRLAVQAQVPMRAVPAAMLDDGRWSIVRTEAEALPAERRWLGLHTRPANDESLAPGARLGLFLVRRYGPAILHAGTRPTLVLCAAVVVGLLGVGSGWLGHEVAGFLLLGAAWLIERFGSVLAKVEREALLASGIARQGSEIFGLLIDLGFVAVAAWRSELPDVAGVPQGATAFAPLLLVGGTRLARLALPGRRWAASFEDRLLLGLGLAVASVLLPFDATIGLAVLALFGTCLFALRFTTGRSGKGDRPGGKLSASRSGEGSPNSRLTSER